MSYKIKMLLALAVLFVTTASIAQVNSVQFGKNRVQHKKFKWRFYETDNFHTYFNVGGNELAKYAAQIAEEELPQIEEAVEYSLQRKASIIVYNDYNDYKSSNIGLGSDWQNTGGGTKLVNNKLVIYFDGNHANLRLQIRMGLAKTLTDNILFGDDVGEFASNQALLDLPKWLTDGYATYVAEPWSTKRDNDLKVALLSGDYKNFYQFAFKQPDVAGHAFWYYVADKYKKENVTYFLYLARIYKNLNSASQKITKKKFKDLLAEFMEVMSDRYYKELRGRRNALKGQISVIEEVDQNKDFIRFNANPNPRSPTYAVVRYKKGRYSVILNENYTEQRELINYGVRVQNGQIHPTYPILAWDGKGSRLLTIYWEDGKIKMFVYDAVARFKRNKQVIEGFDQIIDASFMLDANTLIFSAVKNGHTDIFTYKIETEKVTQLTNDVYDDLDPTFVSFPNRSGVIFASNRPSVNAPDNDTVLPSKYRYNIFMVDVENKGAAKQITQLSNVKQGNARLPMQYNTNHFTFVSDEQGVANRYAGFFSTSREGLDTLYYIGDEILRNPSDKEMDSTLVAWQKPEPDSISYFQVYKDSTYTFPITNYQSSLLETRVAGDRGQVSEVRQEGNIKFLYKLRVDSVALRKRNINPKPTEYVKKLMQEKRDAEGKAIIFKDTLLPVKPRDIFQTEFDETNDSVQIARNAQPVEPPKPNALQSARLFNYRLRFEADNILAGVTNNILVNRFQAYGGGYGPIQPNNNNDLNYTFRVGVNELMEDVKVIGGIRLGTNLKDNDVILSFQNFRRRLDWGLTFYRSSASDFPGFVKADYQFYKTKLLTTLYQGNIAYPFNEVKSLRFTGGLRFDRGIVKPANLQVGGTPDPIGLAAPDSLSKRLAFRLEYVHDNTLNPAQNIWKGLRFKVYAEGYSPVGKNSQKGANTYNIGFDIRNYVEIYRNFIWAFRAAGDASFGKQKIIYYLGGTDGWLMFGNNQKSDGSYRYFNPNPSPAPDQQYAFQALAVNMRGFKQNIANGNNALVFNSEFRLPVLSTLLSKPVNNAFLRNFQIVQFVDLGTAWNGQYSKLERPSVTYTDDPVTVKVKAGGIGPFAGGYGFGARSTLLGYFVKVDASWQMNGVFKGKPQWYFALGLDF